MNSQKGKFLEIYDSIDFKTIKDHPNILIAANFWDSDRFCAAKSCYKFMRAIDDLIEGSRAVNPFIEGITLERLKAEGTVSLNFDVRGDVPFADGKFPTAARASFEIDGAWASLDRGRHALTDYVTAKSLG